MHKYKKELQPQKAVVLGITNCETRKVKSFHITNESYYKHSGRSFCTNKNQEILTNE